MTRSMLSAMTKKVIVILYKLKFLLHMEDLTMTCSAKTGNDRPYGATVTLTDTASETARIPTMPPLPYGSSNLSGNERSGL